MKCEGRQVGWHALEMTVSVFRQARNTGESEPEEEQKKKHKHELRSNLRQEGTAAQKHWKQVATEFIQEVT